MGATITYTAFTERTAQYDHALPTTLSFKLRYPE